MAQIQRPLTVVLLAAALSACTGERAVSLEDVTGTSARPPSERLIVPTHGAVSLEDVVGPEALQQQFVGQRPHHLPPHHRLLPGQAGGIFPSYYPSAYPPFYQYPYMPSPCQPSWAGLAPTQIGSSVPATHNQLPAKLVENVNRPLVGPARSKRSPPHGAVALQDVVGPGGYHRSLMGPPPPPPPPPAYVYPSPYSWSSWGRPRYYYTYGYNSYLPFRLFL